MSAPDHQDAETRLAQIDASDLPSAPPAHSSLVVLPVAPGRIHARWAVDGDAVQQAAEVAANDPAKVQLVLRAFDMPGADAPVSNAEVWQDFPVDSLESQGYFDVDGPGRHASAVLGIKGPNGHFRGLLQSDSVALPMPPTAEPLAESANGESNDHKESELEALAARELADEYDFDDDEQPAENAGLIARQASEEHPALDESLFMDELGIMGDVPNIPDADSAEDAEEANEAAISTTNSTLSEADRLRHAAVVGREEWLARLEEQTGFQMPTTAEASLRSHLQSQLSENGSPPDYDELVHALPDTPSLDEDSLLLRLIKDMAGQGLPGDDLATEAIRELEAEATAVAEDGPEALNNSPEAKNETTKDSEARSGASELLASNWADVWGKDAPIELKASLVICGRIGNGLKMILAGKPVEPLPGGRFVVKQPLKGFDAALQMIHAATQPHDMAAGPALEVLKQTAGGDKLLEIHAALNVEGRLTDPDYARWLPEHLSIDAEGVFRLTRFLPQGAVVLPGMVLIGE